MKSFRHFLVESSQEIFVFQIDDLNFFNYLDIPCDEPHDSHGGLPCGEAIRRYADELRTRPDQELHPIEVLKQDGKLLVMDGHHRVNAARVAGRTKIRGYYVDS